ncbi:hypothetical protein B0F90DRAFT_156135 [Multifurca ochricompacta]|uniref:Uncharacterized protein n=1 Tax=Multifurca ochricompacta TaxID=376703 RepID=A0AAD4MFF0_9AGAM|nr:hypothetical protein B0F90DRAFT_156135 [Multifurca ochricompacta]
MTINISSSPPTSGQSPPELMNINQITLKERNRCLSTGRSGHPPRVTWTGVRVPSAIAIIPAANGIQRSLSDFSSNLGKFSPVEGPQLLPTIVVVCAEVIVLKCIRRPTEDVISTVFFTILFGGFAWPVWSNLKRMHDHLDEIHGKIEALQYSVTSLELASNVRPAVHLFLSPIHTISSPTRRKKMMRYHHHKHLNEPRNPLFQEQLWCPKDTMKLR